MDEMTTESFPPVASEAEFRELYLARLHRHSTTLIEEVRRLLARTDVSPDVTGCEVRVFPDEYGDGQVSICMYFNGPNRLVRTNDSTLYCGAVFEFARGVNDIPLHDSSEYPFDTRDVTVRCVIDWFAECWQSAGGEGYRLPVTIVPCDGFGPPNPIPLTR